MQARAIRSNDDIDNLAPGAPRQNVGRGLYLLPSKTPNSSHGWRFDYTHNGRRKTLSLGTYPAVTLEKAEDLAGVLRTQLQAGQDPASVRRLEAHAARRASMHSKKLRPSAGAAPKGPVPGSFEDVALRWYEGRKASWTPSYADKVFGRLRLHVLPRIGRRPVGELTSGEILDLCRSVQATGTIETGRRVCKICSAVFCKAVVEGLAERDFCREVLTQLQMPRKRHFAAITDPRELGDLLRSIDAYHGTFVVKSALQLAPLLMVRPGELRQALWSEIDLDNAMWLIPPERMKGTLDDKSEGDEHLVPLSRQAVQILEGLFALTGRTGLVFPGQGRKGRFMSNNTLNAALRSMGYCTQEQVTAHGFRATARTMLVERLKWHKDYAEMQLAHAVSDANGRAYNRTEFDDDRVLMMQAWSDYLDELRSGKVTTGQRLRDRFTPVTNRFVPRAAVAAAA